jgi:hypothetical protein
MKLPGEAVLEFHITTLTRDKVELSQNSRFLPRGLGGMAYWYILVPFHHWIFRGMLKAMAVAVSKPILQGPEPEKGRHRQAGPQ